MLDHGTSTAKVTKQTYIMPQYKFGGVQVHFPFEAYELQKKYMAKVIECLQNNVHGVLESPSGTGKKLSLLCSSMAWLQYMKSRPTKQRFNTNEDNYSAGSGKTLAALNPELALNAKIKIIYASSTHSQLSRAMLELKNTIYGNRTDQAVILGTRDQLCVHPEISKKKYDTRKTTLCRKLVKAKHCEFHAGVESAKDHASVMAVPVLDIEDLVTVGRKLNACPYYLSKELIEKADIIFMPHVYLLDPKMRKLYGLNLQNSVIIVEEAHNVNQTCEEICSAQLRESDIALTIENTSFIIKTLNESGKVFSEGGEKKLKNLESLKKRLIKLKDAVVNITIEHSQGGSTHPGSYIFDLLKKANIKFDNINEILQMFHSIITFINTEKTNRFIGRTAGLQSMVDFLEVVYAGSGQTYSQSIEKSYRVHVEYQKLRHNFKPLVTTSTKIVSFWCFNPGYAVRQLVDSGTRSILLTSGTLAPLQPFISELGLSVPIRLENSHIIDKHQVYVKIVSHGSDRNELNSSFKNRSKPEYIASLGCTVLALCPIIPGGFLICFPSYSMLKVCCEAWQHSPIWKQINDVKQIFVEPQDTVDTDRLARIKSKYYAKVRDQRCRGAVFLAVCRGKALEELDYTDACVRVVMIAGIPFPPLMDARVVQKRQYLDDSNNTLLSGNIWYTQQAFHAINQAVGRIISHRNDYGAVLLCDTRFQDTRHQYQLPSWVRSRLQESSKGFNFGTVVGETARFFRSKAAKNSPTELPEGGAPTDKENGAGKPKKMKRSLSSSMVSILTHYVPDFRIKDAFLNSEQPSRRLSNLEGASSSGLSILHKQERVIDSNGASTAQSQENSKKLCTNPCRHCKTF